MKARLEASKENIQSQDTKENAHVLLAESKKERIKSEVDARALRNRINLLMNEEKKAQRKLEETQKKAKALASLKLENQHHLIEKEEVVISETRGLNQYLTGKVKIAEGYSRATRESSQVA